MRCPKCGHKNSDDEAFCVRCGIEMMAYQRDIAEQEPKPAPEPVAPVPPQPNVVPTQELPEPRCPKCSGPMERGIMLAPHGGLLGGVRWDTADGIDLWGLKGEVLVSTDLMANSIRIPGFRCPTCRVLVLTY
jgi:hypothetical protein